MNLIPIALVIGAALLCAAIAILLPHDDDDPGGDSRVSGKGLRAIVRHDQTRGVDLTTWKTPPEGCANAHTRR